MEAKWDQFSESVNRRITYIIPFEPLDVSDPPFDATALSFTDGTNTWTNFLDTDADSSGTRDGVGADNDTAKSIQFLELSEADDTQIIGPNPAIWETKPKESIDLDIYYEASECFDKDNHNNPNQQLDWFNCYSFGNGVESNRLRDDFNQITIDKGAVASSTVDFVYEEEKRKSGLIYSGLYNSINGVNNLNQFIAAEKITKDLNPTYGSIQKLFSRNTDLVTLCEDRIIRILANKDAIFNADGNPNLVATGNVLGQTMPFSGDYGISQNPESFAKQSYRAYFTDKQRGVVLRLSMDGLTPISQYGMSDYFKDNLKQSTSIIGTYDENKNDYNVSLINKNSSTVSFNEQAKGWSSFKSFIPETGISMANDYYTFKDGNLYKHHIEVDTQGDANPRNTFYNSEDAFTPSSVTVLLNDEASTIKSYRTLNYTGSQSQVTKETSDLRTGYYNLEGEDGWYTEYITSDVKNEKGYINEFIKKEGKWFNYIKGDDVAETLNIKTDEFSFQGLGIAKHNK